MAMKKKKRDTNFADYIKQLRALYEQNETPAKENSPKKTATAYKKRRKMST